MKGFIGSSTVLIFTYICIIGYSFHRINDEYFEKQNSLLKDTIAQFYAIEFD